MKRILLILLISVIPLTILSQKVTVRVIIARNASVSEWMILDEKYLPVLTGNEYPSGDTIVFSLEANTRYFFEISVSEITLTDTCLYSLCLNNEAVLRITSEIGHGDHFFSFFTGTKEEKDAKITGGTAVDISDFPWQVYLESEDFTCGGSIISDNWIITAAHCAKDDNNVTIPASEMLVVVGANNPRNPFQGDEYYVSEVIVHEDFDSNTLNNDIALLKLEVPIDYPNAEPIKLVSAKDASAGVTDPGVMTWVTGYGITIVDPPTYPSTLQMIRIPIVSNSQASIVWPRIAPTDMMAGYRNSTRDACTGDSGGPLVVAFSGGYKLAGLVSWGSSDCDTYGAYTRLSLFESWITSKTGIEITFNAPVPAGDSIICPGTASSQYHAATVTGADAYIWSLEPDDAGTINGNSETAIVSWNPGFSGRTAVRLQVSRNNELSEISELTVNLAKQTRLLTESEDTVLCAEQTVTLQVVTEGYNLNYKWYKSNDLLPSGNSNKLQIPDALADDSGNYFCEVEGSCGNITSRTINLTVLPVTRISGITPDTDVPFGDDLTLEVSSEGHNLSYQWYKDDNRLDNGVLPSIVLDNVNANNTGLYNITVTGTCGTEISSDVYVYIKKEDHSGEPGVFVWPTVINDEFSIALSNNQNYNILLCNTTGRILKLETNCQYLTKVDAGKLPPGIYIVTIYNNRFRESVKLIKR